MAAAPPLFSNIYGNGTLWEIPDPDYATLLGIVGGASTANRNECAASIVATAVRSPLTAAFVLHDDPDYIYVAHSFTVFPPDITTNMPMD